MQRSPPRAVTAIFIAVTGLLFDTPAHAQYSGNSQTNITSGVTSNWSGDYIIGISNAYDDVLLIQSGGVLSNDDGYVGGPVNGGIYGGGNDVAVVSGTGSVWNNSGELYVGSGAGNNNLLIVTNGGAVYSVGGSIAGSDEAAGNTVLVTGSGSVWSNAGNFSMGGPSESPSDNSLIIADGGIVYNGSANFGSEIGGANNEVLVTGSGSEWITQDLFLGGELQITIVITNGGVLSSSSALLGGEGGRLPYSSLGRAQCGTTASSNLLMDQPHSPFPTGAQYIRVERYPGSTSCRESW
jgi:T5SS/PEP-CTERM-associated repeat protein